MQNSDASCKVLIAAVEHDTTTAQENKEKDGCSVRRTDAEGSQKIQRPNANATKAYVFFAGRKVQVHGFSIRQQQTTAKPGGIPTPCTQGSSTTIIQMRSDTMQLAEVTAMEAYALGCYCYSQFTATRNRPMVTWLDRQVGNQRLGRRTRVV